ncbi:MAG: hypothetical protein JO056_08180 [Alphaproteobacteria bacterium]|nr:hypothetical protein [Alphaproteobacteria bacterium]
MAEFVAMECISRRLALAQLAAMALPLSAHAGDSARETGRLTARPRLGTPAEPSPPKGYSLLGPNKDDRTRDAVLYAPANFDALKPAPLLVFLHGAGENGALMAKTLREVAEARGFLLLAPTSRGLTWDLHRAPACPDTATVDAAMKAVFSATTIDPRHIALGGFSDGGSFAISLGLANGDLFSDVLAFSAGFFHAPMGFGRPRVFLSHGRRDRVIDFGMGRDISSRLRSAGYDVRFEPFDGDHDIPKAGLDIALNRFLGMSSSLP